MISIRNFTHRLGNQLFQIAAAISLANRSGDQLSLQEWRYSDSFPDLKFSNFSGHEQPEWNEPAFHYNEIPVGVKTLQGYYQTEKYFDKDLVSSSFQINSQIVEDIKRRYDFQNSAAIHVRRGDYVGLQHCHPLMTIDYFKQAIEDFDADNLFILSDDPDWCKVVFPEGRIIRGNTDIEDLCIMTLVDKIAISNSTFSWWGAWLNKNKSHVVAPQKWFGPAYACHDTKDIYCDGWDVR